VWRPFEIHPEVPAAGMPLSALGYPPEDLAAIHARLRSTGAGEGIVFAARSGDSLLANTHRALAASAFVQAEDPQRFEALHHALFEANFRDLLDVGDPGVLHRIVAGAGIDADRLDAALAAGGGDDAVREAAEEAHRRGIRAVPAFVFGGREIVVGAHPPEALVQAAERAAEGR